jgi:Kef-type K+ transport system membrane component KefB
MQVDPKATASYTRGDLIQEGIAVVPPGTASYDLLTNPHPLIPVGILLICGYVGGRIANAVRAPRVTGYILAGALLSPSVTGVLTDGIVRDELSVITDIALGVIAFAIGGTLKLEQLKRLGKPIMWITSSQAFAAFAFTTAVILALLPLIGGRAGGNDTFWGLYFPMALVIGAMSAATAPAATLAIVHETRARGPLTTVLLGVVALDDGATIFLYALAVGIARALVAGEPLAWGNALAVPVASILIATGIGGLVGFSLRYLIRFVPRREGMLAVAAGAVFVTSGVAMGLGASALFANMILGFVVINFVPHAHHLFEVLEPMEEPLFGMFFTLAGAHLDLGVIPKVGALALVIMAGRFSGKLTGTNLGARVSRAPDVVRKYLGLALLPKAGVTVGLVLLAKDLFGTAPLAEVMVSAVLASVVLNEMLAPVLARYALIKAGEASTG